MKPQYLIYKTTCLVNGKFYVGKHKTYNIDDGYCGSGKVLRAAINSYGIENFVTETLLVCSSAKQMDLAERILVVVDRAVSYNLCPGGSSGGFEEINSYATYEMRSAWLKGKKQPPFTVEWKSRISAAKQGKPSHMKGKKRKPFTKEWKQKMSDSAKARCARRREQVSALN